MTYSISCQGGDDVTISEFPQKLNVKAVSLTLCNTYTFALGNTYNHHFNKQKVTFDTLHLWHLVILKQSSLIPSCLPERARKILYTKLQQCITKPNKYFQTNEIHKHSILLSAEVKHGCSYTATSLYAFMACLRTTLLPSVWCLSIF
jgi:hypothetical protein